MEVILLEQVSAITSDERERLILGIVASKSGIYGCEVCQYCGRLGTFSGWAGAIGSHRSGEFVPSWHRHGNHGESLKRLAESDRRFCEVCRTKVSRSDTYRAGSHWLCDVCAADPKNRDEDAASPLQNLNRRRYVEARSDVELLAWAKSAGEAVRDAQTPTG